MHEVTTAPPFIVKKASPYLMPYVSHFWLGLNNQDSTYLVLPDGCVDVVIKIQETSATTWVYGTTTQACRIALDQECHYVGIRFVPGQSRHFLHASAHDLLNRCESAQHVLKFQLDAALNAPTDSSVLIRIEQLLQQHIQPLSPPQTRLDHAIKLMQASHGQVSVDSAAAEFCRSKRQFERVFLETVGVSPKVFSQITRFQYALTYAKNSASSLTDVATQAGYADQSHMTHEFQRFALQSPMQFMQENVAFLQD